LQSYFRPPPAPLFYLLVTQKRPGLFEGSGLRVAKPKLVRAGRQRKHFRRMVRNWIWADWVAVCKPIGWIVELKYDGLDNHPPAPKKQPAAAGLI
jgi:hypothetical protein